MPGTRSDKARLTYQLPQKGLLSMVPASWVPYGELMRLHKPAGYFAFYFPHVTGFLFAQNVVPPSQSLSIEEQVTAHLRLLAGSLLLRGASCTWNDVLDADCDRQVERTRLRPIPRNAVSKSSGIFFTVAQSLLGVTLTLAPLPEACRIPAVLFFVTQAAYPYFKRFTNYPSLWLGISFAWGVAVGAGAGGVDVISLLISYFLSATGRTTVSDTMGNRILGSMTCLYASCVLNSMLHDVIYGHQDLKDDLKAGIYSPAVAWRGKTKRNCTLLIIMVISLLVIPDHLVGLGLTYELVAVGGTAWVLGSQLYKVNLDDPDHCMKCFKQMIYGTGIALSVGLMLAHVLSS